MSDALSVALIAVLVAIPPTLVALAAFLKSRTSEKVLGQVLHQQNGLLTALLTAARREGYQSGLAEGRAMRRPPEGQDDPPPGLGPG